MYVFIVTFNFLKELNTLILNFYINMYYHIIVVDWGESPVASVWWSSSYPVRPPYNWAYPSPLHSLKHWLEGSNDHWDNRGKDTTVEVKHCASTNLVPMPGHLKYMLRPSVNVYRVIMLSVAIGISMAIVHVAFRNKPTIVQRWNLE